MRQWKALWRYVHTYHALLGSSGRGRLFFFFFLLQTLYLAFFLSLPASSARLFPSAFPSAKAGRGVVGMGKDGVAAGYLLVVTAAGGLSGKARSHARDDCGSRGFFACAGRPPMMAGRLAGWRAGWPANAKRVGLWAEPGGLEAGGQRDLRRVSLLPVCWCVMYRAAAGRPRERVGGGGGGGGKRMGTQRRARGMDGGAIPSIAHRPSPVPRCGDGRRACRWQLALALASASAPALVSSRWRVVGTVRFIVRCEGAIRRRGRRAR